MRKGVFLAAILAVLVPLANAAAQTTAAFPNRPLRLVIPFAPGGAADTVGRTLARHLGESLGQSVVVENRPGGNGVIGVDAVAKAPADGHAMVLSALGALVVTPQITRTPYDPMRDLAPVTLAVRNPLLLVAGPAMPARDIAGLIELARARPGEIGVGTSGTGSTNHLAVELLNSMAGIRLLHVPYRGEGPAMTDLIAGQVPLAMVTVVASRGHILGGRARALGAATAQRTGTMPEVPTIAEAGVPGYAAEAWLGVLVPAATPAPAVERLNAEITAILRRPEVVEALRNQGADAAPTTAAEFAAYLRSEWEKYGRLARAVELRAD